MTTKTAAQALRRIASSIDAISQLYFRKEILCLADRIESDHEDAERFR